MHRPKTDPPSFAELIDEVRIDLPIRYSVAGRITIDAVAPAVLIGFTTLIIGGAVADSTDPLTTWTGLLAQVRHLAQ